MMKFIGYARVSTQEQELGLQIDALKKQNIAEENIYHDKISGLKKLRPGLTAALKVLKEGDTLVVWKLDRLGRSLSDLIQIVQDLKKRGVHFKSVTECIDTNSPGGNLIFHMFGAFAEFERKIIQERTNAGLKVAKARGARLGRPKIKANAKCVKSVKQLYDNGLNIHEIAELVGTSTRTIYRRLGL